MQYHGIIIKQTGSNRHGPSQVTLFGVPAALTYQLNLTQKLHHLTQ